MSTAVAERPAPPGAGTAGVPARRAVIRWALRLLRREWRQQVLILALITVAVAATFMASAVATTTRPGDRRVRRRAGHRDLLRAARQASTPRSRSSAPLRPGRRDREPERCRSPARSRRSTCAPRIPRGAVRPADAQPGQRRSTPRGRPGRGDQRGRRGLPPGGRRNLDRRRGQRKVTGIVQNPQNLLDEFALVVARPGHRARTRSPCCSTRRAYRRARSARP